MISVPPVIERELRVSLQQRRVRNAWMDTARGAGVVTVLILFFSLFDAAVSNGRLLFGVLCLGGVNIVVRGGIRITSDLFSEERRNGTLGLLVLTGLSPLEIFASKLTGAVLTILYRIAAGFPFLGVAFVMGGVQFNQFVGLGAWLLTLLLLCTALGTLGSVLHRDGGAAQVTAIGLLIFLATAPWALQWLFAPANPSTGGLTAFNWRGVSPVYGVIQIFRSFPDGTPAFWNSFAIVLAVALVAILIGAVVLNATWRESWDDGTPRWWTLVRRYWPHWANGPSVWIVRRRRRELAVGNPFAWLASRHHGPVSKAKGFMGVTLALWFAGWAWFGATWICSGSFIVVSVVIHVGLNWAIAYAAAQTLAVERQDGGLELLLTTPLGPKAIVDGQKRALLFQFRSVVAVAFALDIAFCAGGLVAVLDALKSTSIDNRPTTAAITHLVCWGLMLWFWTGAHWKSGFRAMWIGLWTGRPGYAAFRGGWIIPWPIFVIGFLLWDAWLRDFPHGHMAELHIVGLTLILVALGTYGMAGQYREKLRQELRDIANAPIPKTGDKAFARWDPDKIKPPEQWRNWIVTPPFELNRPRRKHDSESNPVPPSTN